MDQDALVGSRLRPVVEGAGHTLETCTSFESARTLLRTGALPSALIVNVRLGRFNGIHLAYLANLHGAGDLRTLVYARPHDPMLALEAQRAGAFYLRQGFLPHALPGFLRAGLPPADRRDVGGIDRRATFRGGRRATDVASLHVATGGQP